LNVCTIPSLSLPIKPLLRKKVNKKYFVKLCEI